MTKEQEKAMLEAMKILIDCVATDKESEFLRAKREDRLNKAECLKMQADNLHKAWLILDSISID